MKKKIIQVPMPYELLKELDAAAKEKGESRASMVREACAEYIAASREAELVRQYIEELEKHPETEEEREWVAAGTALATDVWTSEDWSKEYEEFVRLEKQANKRRAKR